MKKLVCLLLVILTVAMLLSSCASLAYPSGEANGIRFLVGSSVEYQGPGEFKYINDNLIWYRVEKSQRIYYINAENLIYIEQYDGE